MTKRKQERRATQRADARLSMRVEVGPLGDDGTQIVTESQNISSRGVYCHSAHYMAPLSKVAVTIVLPQFGPMKARAGMLKCEGVVVRCEQLPGRRASRPYELACAFTDLDDDRRRLLSDYVTWRNLQALRAAARGRTGNGRSKPRRPRTKTVAARKKRVVRGPRRRTVH